MLAWNFSWTNLLEQSVANAIVFGRLRGSLVGFILEKNLKFLVFSYHRFHFSLVSVLCLPTVLVGFASWFCSFEILVSTVPVDMSF